MNKLIKILVALGIIDLMLMFVMTLTFTLNFILDSMTRTNALIFTISIMCVIFGFIFYKIYEELNYF